MKDLRMATPDMGLPLLIPLSLCRCDFDLKFRGGGLAVGPPRYKAYCPDDHNTSTIVSISSVGHGTAPSVEPR
jgi:hypothetical protein